MYKAIIFDMDGVILDTEKLLMKCWKEASKDYNINLQDQHISNMRGCTPFEAKKVFEAVFGKELDFFELRGKREELKEKFIKENGVPVKEGVEDFLIYLKNKNIKIGLATSTAQKIAMSYLKEAKLSKYFDVIICGDMIERGKPNPDIYIEALENLDIKPKEALIFEDSKNGILAGYGAGCDIIMVVDIDSHYEETEDKIILKIDDYKEAIKFLENIK